MYSPKASLLTYFWSLKVCHPRYICIVRNNKNKIRQYTTLCYRESKIATCFGCTWLPSSDRLFQKCKTKLYKIFLSLCLYIHIYIYIYTHTHIHTYTHTHTHTHTQGNRHEAVCFRIAIYIYIYISETYGLMTVALYSRNM